MSQTHEASPADGESIGPSLPMNVYTCGETWNPDRIGALAIYCSDGRWGEAFDEFCQKRLLLPRYDRWAVPGGPAWLVPGAVSSDVQHATREQIDLLVRVHQLTRIVLISHYGCAFYRERLRQPPQQCLSTQMDDLRTAINVLHGGYPNMQLEAYVAMQKGKCLSFHQMAF